MEPSHHASSFGAAHSCFAIVLALACTHCGPNGEDEVDQDESGDSGDSGDGTGGLGDSVEVETHTGDVATEADSDDGPDSADATLDAPDVPQARDLTVRTLLAAYTLAVTDVADVYCVVTDPLGTLWNLPTTIDVPVEIERVGTQIRSSIPGRYEVTCRLSEGDATALLPATVDIVPRAHARIEVALSPRLIAYPRDAEVEVTWEAFDGLGNPVILAPHEVTLTTTPTDVAAPLSPTRFRMARDGVVVFGVTSGGVDGSAVAIVDTQAPVPNVAFPPARAAMVAGVGPVLVEGTFDLSGSPIVALTVDGQAATVQPDGSFAIPVEVRHGLNIVALAATDAAGNVGTSTRVWLQATAFSPLNEEAQTSPSAPQVRVRLGTDALLGDAVETQTIDDLAHALTSGLTLVNDTVGRPNHRIVNAFAWQETGHCSEPYAELQSRAVTFEPHLASVGFSRPSVAGTEPGTTLSLGTADGALAFQWSGTALAEILFETISERISHAQGCGDCTGLGPWSDWTNHHSTAKVPAVLPAAMSAQIRWDPERNPPALTVSRSHDISGTMSFPVVAPIRQVERGRVTICVTVREVRQDFQAIFTNPGSQLQAVLVNAQIPVDTGQKLEELLDANVVKLNAATRGVERAATATIGESVNDVSWKSELMSVNVIDVGDVGDVIDSTDATEGALELVLGASAFALPVLPPTTRGPGSIRRGDCLGTNDDPLALSARELATAMPLDLLNQLLYAGWTSTVPFTLDASAVDVDVVLPPGVSITRIELSPGLPTVLTDCGGALEAHVGRAQVDIHYDVFGAPVLVATEVSFTADLTVSASDRYMADIGAPTVLSSQSTTSPPDGPGELLSATDLIALEVAIEALVEAPLADLFDAVRPPEFSLAPFGTNGKVMRRTGPVSVRAGHLVQDDCADVQGEVTCE